jgi:hypothetical protein
MWGLGIEHEMLFVESIEPGGIRKCISSARIVESLNLARIRPAFDAVDDALHIKLPRLFELQLTSNDSLTVESRTDPYIGILKHKSAEDIEALLVNVSDFNVTCVLVSIAPYMTPDLSTKLLKSLTSNETQHTKQAFAGNDPRAAAMFARAASTKGSREKLSQVLAGAQDVLTFYEKIQNIVEHQLIEDLQKRLCLGTVRLSGNMRGPFPVLNLEVLPGSKKNKECSYRNLVSTTICLMQAQVVMDRVPWLNLDTLYVEVKTIKHKNATVKGIIAELETRSKAALRTFPGMRMLEHSGYSRILFVDPLRRRVNHFFTDWPLYAGSFHFWFTLPHEKVDQDFARKHALFANAMQFIEPLLMSLCGGDPSCIGRGSASPRASFRSTRNAFGGIGTTDVCLLAETAIAAVPEDYPLVYFNSPEDFLLAFNKHNKNEPRVGVSYLKNDRSLLFMTVPGVGLISVPGCISFGRKPREGRLNRLSPSASALESHVPSAPHNQILRMAYSAGYSIQEGSDVRVLDDWCRSLRIRLQKDWQAYPVRKGNKFHLFFYNFITGETSENAPLEPEKNMHARGFEFRMLDNIPRSGLGPLLDLFVLIAAASSFSKKTCEGRVQADADWSQLVADVSIRGRYAKVSKNYKKKLCSKLDTGLTDCQDEDVYQLLKRLAGALYKKYNLHPWVSAMAPGMTDPGPRIKDSNSAAWNEAFAEFLQSRPGFHEHFMSGTKLGPGFLYDLPYIAAFKKTGTKIP